MRTNEKKDVKPRKVHALVRLLINICKFIALAYLVISVVAVAVDHNKINQLKKEELRLNIEVLKLQLTKLQK